MKVLQDVSEQDINKFLQQIDKDINEFSQAFFQANGSDYSELPKLMGGCAMNDCIYDQLKKNYWVFIRLIILDGFKNENSKLHYEIIYIVFNQSDIFQSIHSVPKYKTLAQHTATISFIFSKF